MAKSPVLRFLALPFFLCLHVADFGGRCIIGVFHRMVDLFLGGPEAFVYWYQMIRGRRPIGAVAGFVPPAAPPAEAVDPEMEDPTLLASMSMSSDSYPVPVGGEGQFDLEQRFKATIRVNTWAMYKRVCELVDRLNATPGTPVMTCKLGSGPVLPDDVDGPCYLDLACTSHAKMNHFAEAFGELVANVKFQKMPESEAPARAWLDTEEHKAWLETVRLRKQESEEPGET